MPERVGVRIATVRVDGDVYLRKEDVLTYLLAEQNRARALGLETIDPIRLIELVLEQLERIGSTRVDRIIETPGAAR